MSITIKPLPPFRLSSTPRVAVQCAKDGKELGQASSQRPWRAVFTRRLSGLAKAQFSDERPGNPLLDNLDVLQHLVQPFVEEKAYLFVASVSRRWRDAWGDRPKITSCNLAVQSRPCLDWASAAGLDIGDNPCRRAATEGRLDVLQHAVSLGFSQEGMPVCEYAAGAGHLDVLKWCRARGFPWGQSSVRAAESGHFNVLRYCRDHGCPWDLATFEAAATGGFLDVLEWGLEEAGFSQGDLPRLLAAAAGGGKLRVIKWCRTMGCPWSPDTCYEAARGGHLELLKVCREQGCPWSPETMRGAVESGHLEMLVWCKTNGSPWNGTLCRMAARCGDLGLLEWCVANEDPASSERHLLCAVAAGEGHLHVLEWCRARGFPWGLGVCFSAASGGHFEVLKWCVANGCKWDSFVERYAGGFRGAKVFKGSVEVMSWATLNGCPWISDWIDLTVVCKMAVKGDNLELLRWCAIQCLKLEKSLVSRMGDSTSGDQLDLQGSRRVAGDCEIRRMMQSRGFSRVALGKLIGRTAAGRGNLEILQWCRDGGCPRDTEVHSIAKRRGDLEMLAWCRVNDYR